MTVSSKSPIIDGAACDRHRTPRLLWLTENFFPSSGGMAQSCDRIVHGLRAAGIAIDLIHLMPPVEEASGTDQPQAPTARITDRIHGVDVRWTLGDDVAHDFNRLLTWIQYREKDADTSPYTQVVAFGGKHPVAIAPLFARWFDATLMVMLRGNDFDAGIFSVRHRPALLEALRDAQVVACVNREKVKRIQALVPGVQVRYTPNGIDLTDWRVGSNQQGDASTWRETCELDGRLVIGCFGHLKQKKGIGLLLDAIAHSGYADRIHLHLVGSLDPQIEQILARDQETLSATTIPFIRRCDLPGEYAKCDIVAIPSFYDGMPNVLLEAGGLGCPILASDTGGMSDVLKDGLHAHLFHPGEMVACAEVIRKAVEQSVEARRAMGSALQEHIAAHFTAEQEVDQYLKIIHETHAGNTP